MFSRIALLKLNDLIKRTDFIKIISVSDNEITVQLKNKSFTITSQGRVTWKIK